ncbi:L-glutamine ABC transporter membrane protein /L-glutamate ABC transporter membrane protein /L-aspartate ABC transporter membrane protein /L-asparagine ABC transporter membrane protein [Aliiroseovarius sediminilitoris]|uniref:L-glutamine ABC transporter membrane protein /L-glutamate ABC transporter membrane protein /L-aspartate ABC transporter membrane protein /L-asparagine ABC transporter membrane protein n=1 Tax=Aliiroseovarius sediminilitoris TaxID=1173584 RepID=A0A1I0N875_9RHOB|nr:ABC transporter permease subunit [Aliiroseovarius sediminilitoris]SEV97235.1 L-glutamine ABC transporter membrane protein /L-glutamate ABC transporter membrane protein /L-aspartate ABC transporter membrane protein /L-asparagine ABC transporter membrane protein [Aliiroseovarius sediminilitoris]
MTTITDPHQGQFRLSMLLYDSRYRSMTIQIVALIGFLMLIGWLLSNTAQNLADLGKEPSFSFMMEPAGYDINQRLLDYDSQDTHLRASLMGLLNTLLVAVMGCIAATVIGVIIGVLRLSPNWIVSRLSAVYVEGFRNVPVLLWIVFIMAVLIETLPQPSAFRKGEATMSLGDSVAVTNRGIYIPEPLFSRSLGDVHLLGTSSLRFDVSLDLLALLAVLIAGILTSVLIKRRADVVQEATGVRPRTWHWRLGAIVVPFLLVLMVLGFYLGYPALKGFNFQGGTHLRNSLIALWLALSLYTGAFIAEIVRAGILAVSKGQTEAASALGLRANRTMSLVVLPQALRVIIPPLISNYLNLTKNSSLAIAVGYMDITGTLGGITMNQTGRELETVLLLMLVYLTISLTISAVMNWYNESVKLRER